MARRTEHEGGQPEEGLARALSQAAKMDVIMKLSRTVSYAVRATLQLAQLEEIGPVPCSRLAAEGKMPERFLLQILRNLVTHGILRSTRGVDGGYALVRPADQISLLEVIEAIEGPYDAALEVGEGMSSDSQISLRDALGQVTATTRRQLEAIKLSQLLQPPTTQPADA
jgi:Rrf2 family transcriptional regulator, cysteine metabolism repressor